VGRSLKLEAAQVFWPLLQPARYKGAFGGRGSGKSHFFAELLIGECLRDPATNAVCVREVQKSLAQSVKKLLETKIEQLNVGYAFDVQQTVINVRPTPAAPMGGRIIFQGMQDHTSDSIKSLEGFRIAWIEEAQSLSQRSLDLLRPTIRLPDSEIWASWNPDAATDPIDVLLRGPTPPPDSIVVQANYTDNALFPDVLKAEMEYDRARDPEKYAHVWLGGYQQRSEARVFRNWRVEEFETPAGAQFRLGADWGFAVDPSVLIRCYVDGRRLYVDHEAYMVGCEIDMLPDLFARVPESDKWFITADSSRPETISYMRKHGFPRINPAVKGAKSVEEGIEFLKAFDIVVHPRCTHLIDELTLYRYKVDPKTEEVLPVLEDKDNHVIDALRYALEGVRRHQASAPPATVSVPRAYSAFRSHSLRG